MTATLPLAVITGSSSGIGLELAKLAVTDGYAVLLAADRSFDHTLAELGPAQVETLETDLSTSEGVGKLVDLIGDRQVEVLCANAGHGLSKTFLDQDFKEIRGVIDTNISGTLELLHNVGSRMRKQGRGRILITGSIAGFMPGAYQAVYNATKAFINNFSYALRDELRETGVTVTCLMPSVTDSNCWERAGALDTKAATGEQDSPEKPARAGWEAMKAGEAEVSPGLKHTIEKTVLKMTPAALGAKLNAGEMKPGSGE